jgi:formylglycine-generating enzyme required for sulfatase activity
MNAPDAGHRIGLAILIALVVAAAIWIAMQAKRAPAPRADIPALVESPGLVRFRADAWYLPDEPLLGFVAIPAGPFAMGSDPNVDRLAFANERWSSASYQGAVDLPTFYIARYETTVAQYRAFIAATGHAVDPLALGSPGDRPVTRVSWTDALAYARWLTDALKSARTAPALQRLLSDGWRFTLPSEAQWEKAARGGDGRIYPWGSTPMREYAHFGVSGTFPVGSLVCADCAFGLADMSGNVWELTSSPFQDYPFDPATQRGDMKADALFVMRGGSYAEQEATVRAATRGGVDPGARREFIGFRIVLTR